MMQYGMQTAVGTRHETNEDAMAHAPEQDLWFIADGMGGHAAGDVASAIVCETILREIGAGRSLRESIAAAHAAVVAAASADPARRGMGSTVVAVRLDGSTAEVGWVGDSRLYLLRDGRLRQVTRDHSLVQYLVDRGEIRADEAAGHPNKNVLVRTLGFEQPEVDLTTVEVQHDDLLLLCSDGVTGEVGDDELNRILTQAAAPQDAVETLINTVVSRRGKDDATAILIRIDLDDEEGQTRAWLPMTGGVLVGLVAYLIWNWMRPS